MLDINIFRVEKGGNPDLIRESQRRRFANVQLVDEVIELDKEWRKRTVPTSSLSRAIFCKFSNVSYGFF